LSGSLIFVLRLFVSFSFCRSNTLTGNGSI
jgi:hypothetical protein